MPEDEQQLLAPREDADLLRPTSGSWVYGLWRFLLQNVALMPLIGVCGYVALVLADARYDQRYAQKADVETAKHDIQEGERDRNALHSTDVQVSSDLTHLKDDVKEVKDNTRAINDKLDRLMIYQSRRGDHQ